MPTFVLLASIAVALGSCGEYGDQLERQVIVKNRTDETITVEYLVGEQQVGDRELRLDERQTIGTIRADDEYSFVPAPFTDGHCTAAPLVVFDPAGEEIDRLPTGTCLEDGDPVILVVG